ncbi:MAG: DUF1266 domain-containing protein [Defluviitaleaceae bacterium]|nr:DUF1266 domain-containing protein [Defluviitaleaceae bacterium]
MIVQFLRAVLKENFPRNLKSEPLSHAQLRAISVGAILAGVRTEYWDSLITGTSTNTQKSLSKWWGIDSSQTAVETLESIKNKRHSQMYNVILANVGQAWYREPSFEDFMRAYQLMNLPLIDDDIANKYSREVEMLEPHIDKLYNISTETSDDKVEQTLKELLGDDATISLCVQIYGSVMDKYDNYTQSYNNLIETFEELQKRNIVSNKKELERIDTAAWDMGRMVNVARWCYELKYISISQAWEYIFLAENESVPRYADWVELGKSYAVGRAMWGGSGVQLTNTIDIIERLHKDDKSPWKHLTLQHGV